MDVLSGEPIQLSAGVCKLVDPQRPVKRYSLSALEEAPWFSHGLDGSIRITGRWRKKVEICLEEESRNPVVARQTFDPNIQLVGLQDFYVYQNKLWGVGQVAIVPGFGLSFYRKGIKDNLAEYRWYELMEQGMGLQPAPINLLGQDLILLEALPGHVQLPSVHSCRTLALREEWDSAVRTMSQLGEVVSLDF